MLVDERLAPYRGRCRFIHHMPTKPAKYSIKLWMCCDADTKYVYNASIYRGKENANEAICKDLGGKVVCQLLEPLHCEGRNITTDNYFTSLDTKSCSRSSHGEESNFGRYYSHQSSWATKRLCSSRRTWVVLFACRVQRIIDIACGILSRSGGQTERK